MGMSWDDSDNDWEEAELPEPTAAKKETPKEQWDDDDSDDESTKPFVPESKPKDVTKKPTAKIKSKKDLLKKQRAKAEEEDDGLSAAEKKVQMQKLVEEGDYALTEELFGAASGSATKPVNKEEHEALGVLIGKKLAGQSASFHFGTLMKTVLKEA